MRVLYLYMFPLWGNGSGAWLRRLTYQLTQKYPDDYTAAIIAPDKRKLSYCQVIPLKPPHLGVFVGNPELPNAKKYSEFSSIELIETLNYYILHTARAIEAFKPDMIHVFHTAFLPHIARNLANFYKIPFIFTSHGSDLYYFVEDSRWTGLMYAASEKASFITANSDFTRDWFLKLFSKIDVAGKTMVIPCGIDNNIDFSKNVSWIDKKYKFKHKKMVLFTGRLTVHKGVEYLIRAAEKINAEIVILGDGPERPFLESLVIEKKLDNVHILGYFSHRAGKINDFYLRADIYVAPSVWEEPLGLVILEAMVCKTPVVVTRHGGVRTMVKDGKNGILVEPKDADTIADKVNILLDDDKMRKKMGENAYASVVRDFNWNKIASQFYDLYSRTIKK